MAKRITFCLAFAMLVASGVFAQEENWGGAKNFISGEVGLITAGARYERMLAPQISVGGVFYWNTFFILFNELEGGAFARYYIWKGLYAELGLGFHTHTGIMDFEYEGERYSFFGTRTGIAVSPGLGWKFDPGKPGAFFLTPGFTVPITIGTAIGSYGETTDVGVSTGFVLYLSLGYAF